MNSRLSLRPFVMLVGAMLLLFVQARTVAAGAPTRVPVGNTGGTVSGVCSFDVDVGILNDNEYATIFTDSAGNVTEILETGLLKVSLSNGNKSIDLNISGPGRLVPNSDGSTSFTTYGPWLWIIFQDLPDLSKGIYFIHGQVDATTDSGGNILEFSIAAGQSDNLCETLADP